MSSSTNIKADERTPLLVKEHSVLSASSLSLTSSSSGITVEERPVSPGTKGLCDEEGQSDSQPKSTSPPRISSSVGRIIAVLLIGVFISNADGSIVLATYPVIASEFNALEDSSWIITSFALAAAAAQPLYGKLSDIYGRKSILVTAYIIFGLGCLLVGMGTSMWQLIIGRAINGIGAAGMSALVSILITDLVALREVAAWRAYVNVVATTGRCMGGPLGGWLADTVGWRWSFLGQIPPVAVATILIGLTLPKATDAASHTHAKPESKQSKLARIDFLGALLMGLSILAFLFPLELGGVKVPWSHPLIYSLFIAGFILAGLFLATEAWWAREPIFPLELLHKRDAMVSFFIAGAQIAAQVGLMFAVPLYFQVTARASNTVAGAHLMPAVVGNAVGGIASGLIIKRTGRYKALIMFASLFASFGYTLLIVRWHGHTNWAESMYILPGGAGAGIAQSALFISLQAAIDPAHTAVATAALYLSTSVGIVAGMAGVSAVLQEALRRGLDSKLSAVGIEGVRKLTIIKKATSDVDYLDRAKPIVAKVIVSAYVDGLMWTHVFSLICALLAFVGSLFLRQHKF